MNLSGPNPAQSNPPEGGLPINSASYDSTEHDALYQHAVMNSIQAVSVNRHDTGGQPTQRIPGKMKPDGGSYSNDHLTSDDHEFESPERQMQRQLLRKMMFHSAAQSVRNGQAILHEVRKNNRCMPAMVDEMKSLEFKFQVLLRKGIEASAVISHRAVRELSQKLDCKPN